MSFLKIRPGEARNPETEVLPDGRKRLTRWFEANVAEGLPEELALAKGAADFDVSPPAGWDGLRLVEIKLTDELFPKGRDTRPLTVLVFEQIPASAEVAVGSPTTVQLEDGRTAVETTAVQFSTGTYTKGTPGTTTRAGADPVEYLQKETAEDNGTLRTLKRLWVTAGTLSTDYESLQGGALLKRTIVSAVTVPTTPSGYTLVGTPVQSPGGLPVYTYTYYKGTGIVVDAYEKKHQGKAYLHRRTEFNPSDSYTPSVPASRIAAGDRTTYATGLSQPDALAFDSAGNLFIANAGANTVTKVTPLGVATTFATGLNAPQGLSIDAADNLYVSNYGDDTITFITPAGSASYVFSGPGGSVGSAQGADGNLYLCNFAANTVSKITPLGVVTTYATGFSGPFACAFDSAGNLFVANFTAGTISKVTPAAVVTTFASGLTQPTGIAIDDSDNLYVASRGAGVTRYTSAGASTSFATGLGTIGGVALDASGNLYVGTSTGNVVYRYPIATPALISRERRAENGYYAYDSVWAEGAGLIVDEKEDRNQGKLVVYHRICLGSAPDTPAATIAGTVTRITANTREESGYTVYDYTWAEGVGTVVSTVDKRNNGKLITYHRVALGSAPSTPSATIGGTVVLIDSGTRDEAGHTVYDYTWAEGYGTVLSTVEKRNQNKLVIYHRVALGAAPSAPSATISGSVVLIDSGTRDEAGHTVYDYTWAEGLGTIVTTAETRLAGAFVAYHRIALGGAPTAPTATISGTVTLVSSTTRDEAGYTVYDYRWEEANGQAGNRIVGMDDGALVYTVTSRTLTASTPSYPGSGTAYLIALDQNPAESHVVNVATYKKPPANYNFPKTVSWTMPGLATAGNPPVFLAPVTRKLKATFYVSYSTSQNTDTPYSVTDYAQFEESYLPLGSFLSQGSQRALDGYLGDSSASQTANVTYRGISVSQWANEVIASSPTARPTGVTILDTDCELYLTATDGTQVWRNLSVKFTF